MNCQRPRAFVSAIASVSTLLAIPVEASFYDPVDGQFDMGQHIAENAHGFLPIPILITEPAVGYGGGVAGLFMHESEQEKIARQQAALNAIDGGAQLVPAAMTVVGAAGTENGTWFAFGGHRHSWLDDRVRYIGGGGVGVANLDLYKQLSLGPYEKELKFATTTSVAVLSQKVQFRVAQTPLMIGVKQLLALSKVDSDSALVEKLLSVTLGEESITSGLGLELEYDTRDNLFYPNKGMRVSADYMVYDQEIGSDYNYQNLNVEGEGYIPLAKKWTLGLAGNYQHFSQDDLFVSPTAKPYVSLRGVSSYRYQGDEVYTAQSQLTYSINHRWKVSGFYGEGRVNQESSSEQANRVNAGGVGFRYQIARRYGLHLGIDYAISDEESAFYINLGSGLL